MCVQLHTKELQSQNCSSLGSIYVDLSPRTYRELEPWTHMDRCAQKAQGPEASDML